MRTSATRNLFDRLMACLASVGGKALCRCAIDPETPDDVFAEGRARAGAATSGSRANRNHDLRALARGHCTESRMRVSADAGSGSKRGRGGACVISSGSNIQVRTGPAFASRLSNINGRVGGNVASASSSQNSATDWCLCSGRVCVAFSKTRSTALRPILLADRSRQFRDRFMRETPGRFANKQTVSSLSERIDVGSGS